MRFPTLLFSLLVVAASTGLTTGEGAARSPNLYAFQNGLGFGTPLEEARVLSELGYAGVSQVIGTPEEFQKMVSIYKEAALGVRSIYLDAGDGIPSAETLDALAASGAMIELTAKKMEVGSVERIRKICEAARSRGVKVALYPHHGFAIATMPAAMDLIEKAGQPNLGVMFNLCHFLRGEKEADLEEVIREAGDRLFAVSVSGAETGGKEWSELIKPLDKGDFPLERLLKILEETGFEGPVSLQSYGIPGNKKENLRRSMAAWQTLTR